MTIIRRTVFIAVASLLSAITSQAQTPVFNWAKNIGGTGIDMGFSIALDASGNVYVVGRFEGTADFDPGPATFNMTSTVSGTNDIFVLKLDASGNFVWARKMGSSGDDQGLSIALDASGNIYTTGWFQTTADFDPGTGAFNLTSSGGRDIFVSKLDASGNFAWAKSIGGASDDEGLALAMDASGNAYATGFFYDITDFDPGSGIVALTPSGEEDIFILKLDPSGNFIWAKNMGGSDNDHGLSIQLDAAGNIYSTGFFEDTGDFDPGSGTFNLTGASYDIFISKLDAAGNFVWALGMGGISLDLGRSIAIDATGSLLTTGSFLQTADFDPGAGTFDVTYTGNATNNSDGFILKLSNSTSSPLPPITNFTPASGQPGTSVTITGTNFSSTPASTIVTFNGTTAVVTSSTTTNIIATVPTAATTGPITVSVSGNTASSLTDFTVTSGSNQAPFIVPATLSVVVEGTATIDLLTLITDADNNLDVNSLKVTQPPVSGAPASITSGMLTINYSGLAFSGTDNLTIEACDMTGSCAQQQLTVEVTGNIVVYNGISPNGDLLNATWQIKNIEFFTETKNNKVTLYNHWGDEVFSASNYDNNDRVFKGIGNGGHELPPGTYFYKIEFNNLPPKTEYLVLKR